MTHDLICTWLGLPAGNWPPDHYTLLGLARDATDIGRIEHAVHERMERVRRYQLTHPEPATEAMNRLAQALICLTDPQARTTYDAKLLDDARPVREPILAAVELAVMASAPPPVLVAESIPAPPGPPASSDPLAWLFGPWNPPPPPPSPQANPFSELDWQNGPPPPIRLDVTMPPPPASLVDTAPTPVLVATEAAAAAPAPPPAPATPLDQHLEAARSSPTARRGLGTKQALYYRISRTRQLLWAWDRAGRYLSKPDRPLTRPAEANDLVRQLQNLRALLRSFPPLLGEAGQPGNYVITLAKQQQVIPTFQMYLPMQRETLARDWKDGRALLAAHREFLREELRVRRRSSRFGRAGRVMATGLREYTGRILFLFAGLALYLASPWSDVLWRGEVNKYWWCHVLLFVLGFGLINVFLWWDMLWPARPKTARLALPPEHLRVRPRAKQPN